MGHERQRPMKCRPPRGGHIGTASNRFVWSLTLKRRLAALLLFTISFGVPGGSVHAEEGMWTFDNPPLTQLREKYGFTPTAEWLEEHLRGLPTLAGREACIALETKLVFSWRFYRQVALAARHSSPPTSFSRFSRRVRALLHGVEPEVLVLRIATRIEENELREELLRAVRAAGHTAAS